MDKKAVVHIHISLLKGRVFSGWWQKNSEVWHAPAGLKMRSHAAKRTGDLSGPRDDPLDCQQGNRDLNPTASRN